MERSAAARRAAATKKKKKKKKKPSAETLKGYERAAAAAEKKAVAAEEQAKAGGLGAGAMAAAAATAREARARATSARDRLAAAVPSERHVANGRQAKVAQVNGSVKHVNASRADVDACAEAERMLTVEQVALRKMRAQRHGWVCALWVQKQLHVFLARDLEGVAGGKEGWIEKVVAGGGKEREPVRVTKEQLEGQHMVVLLRGRATTRLSRPTRSR
jgi:hypothetical protein